MSNALLEHHLPFSAAANNACEPSPAHKEHSEPLSYLADLAALKSAERQENGVKARIAAARFPTIKTIEAFDFSLQAQLRRQNCSSTSMGDSWISIVTLSSPGRLERAKSHCLVALGRCLFAT